MAVIMEVDEFHFCRRQENPFVCLYFNTRVLADSGADSFASDEALDITLG